MCFTCAVPTIFITLIYFMAHLRYTAAAFFSNFFTVILLGLVSISASTRPFQETVMRQTDRNRAQSQWQEQRCW